MSHDSHRHESAPPPETHPPAGASRYVLDRAACREVDRLAVEHYGVPGIVLMENAARALAEQATRMITADPGATVLIVCGRGNNGGDGWALARHLHNRGVRVVVASLGEPDPQSDAGVNCAICRRMQIPEIPPEAIEKQSSARLIVDALFGTGLTRAVTGRAAEVIEWINGTGRRVLAVDVPSGLDCDTGRRLGPTVRADVTVTFLAAKPGFDALEAQPWVGEIVVGDIGAPRELVERFGRPRAAEPPTRRGR